MKQMFHVTSIIATLAVLFGAGCGDGQLSRLQSADLIIYGGTIYTMDQQRPTTGFVAVADGSILATGEVPEKDDYIDENTKLLDLRGRTMTPGFIESHGHLVGLGESLMNLNLSTTRTYEDMLEIVAAAVERSEPGEWILGRGWHQSKWDPQPEKLVRGFQVHEKLSALTPENPVFLTHASGHASMVNARAMEIAGISSASVFENGGEIIKDEVGNPTGILVELAEELVSGHIPKNDAAYYLRVSKLGVANALENGITTFCDAGADSDDIAAYREMMREGNPGIRLWVMLDGSKPDLLDEWNQRGPEIGAAGGFLTIRAIKLYADGALGSRSAWLLNEYSDRAVHFGYETTPMDSIYILAADALTHGFQACTHAIGDRANREVLDAYERAFKENRNAAKDHRFRIEHAQHLSAADIPRFASLGVIASMQGIHMASDRPWAIDRLGRERIEEGAYVWQKLLQSGAKVINGSDVPVEPINPLACFYASVTRKTLLQTPENGYEAEQRMTREQALRSYTLDAAYAAFEENVKGSIEAGKVADFTIFSRDIMTIPADEILRTRVDGTIVDGRLVYGKLE